MNASRTCRWALALVLAGCGAAHESSDGGPPSGDAGPPQFEVRLESAVDVPLADGGTLDVHYGCQGGAHVLFDVVAIGAGLDGATVYAELLDRSLELTMSPTPQGAELRYFMFVLADSVSPGGLGLPRDEVLRVSVVRADGARVTIERMVHLVDGDTCNAACTYTDVPGTGHITAIDGPTTTGCDFGDLSITFDYTNDSGSTATGVVLPDNLPPDCLGPLGLVVGGDVPVVRQEIQPGGTCTPYLYVIAIDRSGCDAICAP